LKIAILGWGSLVWDPQELRIVSKDWAKGGPKLPIELSRLSSGRGFLTYLIDERHERRVPTRYAISRYKELDDVIADLACREGCPAHSIGYIESTVHGRHRSRTQICWDVQHWAQDKQIDAVVWTDLPSRLPEGIGYGGLFALFKKLLVNLPEETAAQARDYASKAPPEVDTDLRRLLVTEKMIPAAQADAD
jgi:hypothetical protein